MGNDQPASSAKAPVGQLLKRRRTSLRLSLAQVELGTKIRGKYLVKLEAGDYAELPHDIYMKGFVHTYADYLGLDAATVVNQYLAERGQLEAVVAEGPKLTKPKQVIVTPKILGAVIGLLLVGLVVAYLSYQFSALAAAPKLELTSPTSDQVIYGGVIQVSGHASGGADVFINDSPVLTDANGSFNDQLALQDGVNALKVTARNRLGKSSVVSRNILAHLPLTADQMALPAAVFDGIALNVTIKNAATWLIVEVDGKEVFHGTMLAGTTQQFKGSKISLSTGNAGNTVVNLTNSLVAGKNLSPLGGDGEVKRDLEFAKDTSFP